MVPPAKEPMTAMYLICGEALYDVFIDPMNADVRRKLQLIAKPGGSPFNVAIGLARLGCGTYIATEIAGDTLGRNLEARLVAEGVNCAFLRRTAKVTPLAMVDVDPTGKAAYTFHGLDGMLFHPELALVERHWTDIAGIHLGSIPIVSASANALLELLTAAPPRILVSFDPNIRLAIEPDVDRWREAVERIRRRAHLIKVSEDDLVDLYGRDPDLDEIADRWLAHRCSLVAVTRGAAGATYYSRTAGRIEVDAVPVLIADSVGAGDSFQAAMLAWLLENGHASPAGLAALSKNQLTVLGTFAAQAAAATCRHRGPEFPYRKTLQPPV
jgi:fructokinase